MMAHIILAYKTNLLAESKDIRGISGNQRTEII
jgi:hypothetical protein